MIPPGFSLEFFASVNCRVVLAVGKVAVEERVAGAFILEIARDGDVAIPLVDRHGAGLNDGLAGEIALRGYQCPGAVQGGVLMSESRDGEQESRQDRSRNCRS